MKYLLDTCVLLWWVNGSKNIGQKTISQLNNIENSVYVSAASIWEIAIKVQAGKLYIDTDLNNTLATLDLTPLPINFKHGQLAGSLPMIHKDPFDRMLVAQAFTEGLTFITADKIIPEYGVPTIEPFG